MRDDLLPQQISTLLRKYNEPVDPQRLAALHGRLMEQIRMTPQEMAKPPLSSIALLQIFLKRQLRLFSSPRPAFSGVALGFAVMMLGVFVGRDLDPAVSIKTATAETAEQKVSVLAMASPWGELIEKGE